MVLESEDWIFIVVPSESSNVPFCCPLKLLSEKFLVSTEPVMLEAGAAAVVSIRVGAVPEKSHITFLLL